MLTRCPSCGTFIGNRLLYYNTHLEAIMSDPNKTEEEKMQLKTELVNSLGLERYCCKMRVITFINLPTIIR